MVLTAFLFFESQIVRMYCLASISNDKNDGLEWLNLDLWMWNLARIINKLIIKSSFLFLLELFWKPNRTFCQWRQKSGSILSIIKRVISFQNVSAWSQFQNKCNTVSGWASRTISTNILLEPEEIMACRIVSMYKFKRDLPHFIGKKIFIR